MILITAGNKGEYGLWGFSSKHLPQERTNFMSRLLHRGYDVSVHPSIGRHPWGKDNETMGQQDSKTEDAKWLRTPSS